MGYEKISIVSILMACANSANINRWTNGISHAIIGSMIKRPYAQHSLGVGLCTHTYDNEWLAKHYVHCTSCKSLLEANAPLLQGIEP